MKAGLFECDHVDRQYKDQFGDYSDMFAQLFPELEWTFYDVCNGQFPEDLNECDVYFATGSHRSVYEQEDWITRTKAMIRDAAALGKYFIGFCFGHQLLGEAMGGQVKKSGNGWCIGIHEFEVTNKADWMQPFQKNINLLMMCQDQVVQLPEGGKVLSGNKKCPVGIFQVGEKLLGIQAHPEFSKTYDQLLMEKRKHLIGEATIDEGLRSLEKDVHRDVIRSWVLNFIGFNPE